MGLKIIVKKTDAADDAITKMLREFPAMQPLEEEIRGAYAAILERLDEGGKILTCGNGGSSADSGHIVGELMKGFLLPRQLTEAQAEQFSCLEGGAELAAALQQTIPAIDLTAQSALLTAVGNDNGYEYGFAQQVFGYGKGGDVLLAMSTSGNSENVVNAVKTALALGMMVVSITGQQGGKLQALSDWCICLPSKETYRIQEYTLPLYHALCAQLEQDIFG